MKEFFYMLKWKQHLDIQDVISSLRNYNHLPHNLICPACSGKMVMHKDSSRKDSFRWVCKNCRKRRPIRINTWSQKYRISLTRLYLLIRYYVEDYESYIAASRVGLEHDSVLNIYNDLDCIKPRVVEKMIEEIENNISDSSIKDALIGSNFEFEDFSKIFPLSKVFELFLEALIEKHELCKKGISSSL